MLGDPNPEGFDRALFCKSAALPNVTFHLDPDALAGPDGAVPVAKLAAIELDRIIWMPPPKDASTYRDGARRSAVTGA